jgi:hypothetical protein
VNWPESEPIRKSLLPCIPPPEWDFHTWFPRPDGGGDLVPGQHSRGVQIRRRITYGDWEPVRPDYWADEESASDVQNGTDRAASRRCPSCDHETGVHDVDGRCWFTVSRGVPGSNLVCPCDSRRE